MLNINSTQNSVPKHVAIIMDGNGRWASRRGLPRAIGHKQGAEALKRTVRAAGEMGIEYLTLFGFSCENWSRPKPEVKELMRLLRLYLRAETANLQKNNIRLKVIGQRDELDSDIVKLMTNAENMSAENTGITLIIAINYGGRQDILNAAEAVVKQCAGKADVPDRETLEEAFCRNLSLSDVPDPDLLIRTSGEQRISNFLLWQCAYAELYFTDVLWPDFSSKDLENALHWYNDRDRRFGGLGNQHAL